MSERQPIVHCVECGNPITASIYYDYNGVEKITVNAMKCTDEGYICYECIDKHRRSE